MFRNRWSQCNGIGGNNKTEWVVTLLRNTLRKRYWGMHIWARGYFVSTVGIDRDVIKAYVKKQVESQIREQQLQIWKDGSG